MKVKEINLSLFPLSSFDTDYNTELYVHDRVT